MKAIIDIVLLLIIALCTWGGYKKGLIGGVCGLLVIIIALFGGTLLSSAYSGEVIPAMEPFVDGYIDSGSNRDKILENLGYGKSDKSLDDILTEDPSLRYDYAYECMEFVGFYEDRSQELASKTVALSEAEDLSMTQAVIDTLCETGSYVAGLMLAFLMILILLVAIGNVFNLSMRLPNMENLDEIGGAAIGFIKGMVYCVLLCWILSFFGLIIGKDTLENTVLARFFLAFRFITNSLL